MVRLVAGALLFAAPTLRFEERRLDRVIPGCGDVKKGCVHVAYNYVEARGGSAAARAKINAAIVKFVAGEQATPEESAKKFIESRPKDARQPWWIDRSVKVLRSAAPVVSLECAESSYTGGAHGNARTAYLNFNPITGDRVELKKILREGAIPRLTAMAEKALREAREIPRDQDLVQAGFIFLPNGRFALNENYGFGKKELVFFYNPYEIAPYVMGPSKVAIPYDEIRDLFVPGFRP